MLVFLPLLVGYWAWRGPRGWWHWRHAGRTALLLVLPLLVYLWLPVGAARRLPPGTWHPATLGDWAAYLLDRGYLGAMQVQTGLWPKLAVYTKTLLAQFTPWGLALGLLGIVHQVRRRQPLVLLLGPGFLLQALFGAAYEVPRHWVFFLPSFVLFVVWIGDGLAWMFSAATAAGKRRKPVGYALSGLLLALALLLVALPLRQSYPPLRANHLDGGSLDLWRQDLKSGHLAGRFATYSLDAVAPGSIIVTDWEQATPLWYFQQVEGRRPDVQVIYPIRRWPEALATGRPCYVARIVPGPGEPYHFSAAGPVGGVAQEPGFELPSGADPISIQWEEQIELLGYRYYQTDFSRGYVLPVSLYFRANERPSADYSLSLRLWAEDGTQVWSHDRQHPVLGMYPMTRWAPGEVVGDYFEVPFPRSLPAGRYRLGIILYTPAGGGGWRNLPLRGEEAAIGHLPAVDVPPRR